MIEEAVGRHVLFLGEGGIEDSLGGGSTRWLRSPFWQTHTLWLRRNTADQRTTRVS
jgi:hypothetical protein